MSCTCGACTGVTQSTPQPIDNRFGLPAVGYRSGRYPDFRATMIAGLTSGDRPALGALRTREPDDPTIALIDAFACVCDVLTFYTERLANESYLRTATDPTSLQELGRLLGYRPSPGAAARTYLAFTLERPPELPAPLSSDPGLVPPAVPAGLELPVGLRVMSVPGPSEQPVTFETVEQISARPVWNSMPAVVASAPTATVWDDSAYFRGSAVSIKVGDTLLFVGTATAGTSYGSPIVDHWVTQVVIDVTPDPDPAANRTKVSWKPPSAPRVAFAFTPTTIFVLRTTAGVFGGNAPDWRSLTQAVRDLYDPPIAGHAPAARWPNFIAVSADGVVNVEGSRPELVSGGWLVLAGPGSRELYKITARSEQSLAAFAVSGRATVVSLAGPTIFTIGSDPATPRQITCYGGGQAVSVVAGPDESVTPVGGSSVTVPVDVSAMQPGRNLIVAGKSADGKATAEAVVLTAVSGSGSMWKLTLTAGLTNSYQQSSLVLYGNVAAATHGTSVSQLLGDGNAAVAGQSFKLSATPVTQVQAKTTSGTASTLRVSVDGAAWDEVPSLYPAAGTDRVFVTDRDAAGASVVVFGDGSRGSRLPTGSQNVRAKYRQGLGATGNVAAAQLSQPLDRPLGLKAVSNPMPATGGVDPDGPAVARAKIPVSVRTLGRAVSVPDYADFALTFSGIAKADATVLTLPTGQTIVVTVAGVAAAALAAQKLIDLRTELQNSGDPYVAVEVVEFQPLGFRIDAELIAAPDRDPDTVVTSVKQAWISAFEFDVRALNQPVYRSEVIAIAQQVPGVVGVDLNLLYLTGTPRTLQPRLQAAQTCPAQLLTLEPASLDSLTVVQR